MAAILEGHDGRNASNVEVASTLRLIECMFRQNMWLGSRDSGAYRFLNGGHFENPIWPLYVS